MAIQDVVVIASGMKPVIPTYRGPGITAISSQYQALEISEMPKYNITIQDRVLCSP